MASLSSRRGSALLIVLGMVSFMIVSAVGFSVFMRQNRIPSSYLRRNTAARQLAKAALACAMSDIDSYIGNWPAPNVGNRIEGGNRWYGRVLTPYAVGTSTTVSPLSLEGLAYLPPAMVNDVRYYSRLTSTAQWKRLDYDSGRYAFCAIDVSDYFDVNRVAADRPRGSGDANLVTLTYLFENARHSGWGGVDPIDFQDDLDNVFQEAPRAFVSLADYNLALETFGCKLTSPFVEYLKNNGANGFYGWSTPPDSSSESFRKYAIQRFVVDSLFDQKREDWFETNSSSGTDSSNPFNLQDLDISDTQNQPFPDLFNGGSENKNDNSASEIVELGGNFINQRVNQIQPCEYLALYDYLDQNDIPVSVAVPTVERAPMLVGIAIDPDSSLKVQISEDESGESVSEADGIRTTRKNVAFYPEFSGDLTVRAGMTFPFKYRKELNARAGDYSAEAVGCLYAIAEGSTRAENNADRGCRTKIGGVVSMPRSGGNGGVNFNDGLVSMSSRKATTKLPTLVEEENDAVSKNGGSFHDAEMSITGFDALKGKFKSDGYIAKFWLRKRERKTDSGAWIQISTGVDGWEIDPEQNGGKPEYKLNALDFKDGKMVQTVAGQTYVWGLSLAVRLTDKNGKLVDMAPAHVNDDDLTPSGDFKGWLGNLGRPVLRFEGKDGAVSSFTLKEGIEGYKELKTRVEAGAGGQSLELTPSMYLTDDPRYNYAAENWYASALTEGSIGEAWLRQVSCGSNDRQDADIFMSVSNQGYLQDPGELAFLPRVCGFRPSGEDEMKPVQNAATGVIPNGRDGIADRGRAWRTYGCCGDLGDDEVDNLRLISPPRGMRVNPYAQDEYVRLAPFLNTPYDWWAAGTNQTDTIKQRMIESDGTTSDPETSLKYSFSEWGSETKVDFASISNVASRVSNYICDSSSTWYRRWRELDWLDGDETQLCGVTMNRKFHDVDRKYLCSYWRKCYANAQQLFIVFFRAEPVVLGGGVGDGNTPAQLGAKGVAVVWREPTRPDGANADAPHRMRVLFYRQFD